MDLRVYPFKRTLMHNVLIGGGVVVIACGLAFLCADIPLGVCIANSGPGPLILVGMGVLSAVGLIFCLVGGALLYFGSRSYTAVLSTTDFSFGPRGQTKTLKLADITSVTLVYSSQVIRV